MKCSGSTRLSLIIVLHCLASFPAWSQQLSSDSSRIQSAINNASYLYKRYVGVQAGLYNGIEYADYPFKFKGGHPWFLVDYPAAGTLVYDGVRYDSVLLQYNEIADCLLFQDESHRFKLVSERVNAFTVGDNFFVRLIKKESDPLVSTGFYNLLYDGAVQLYSKEVKSIREEIKSGDEAVVRYADSKWYYYIKKEGQYYPVTGRKSIYNILAGKKKELQQYARTQQLSYKQNRDQMLQQLCAYFDQITR